MASFIATAIVLIAISLSAFAGLAIILNAFSNRNA
jgi:hypothetical protein